MACADDRSPLDGEIVARRAAVLCAAAEHAAGDQKQSMSLALRCLFLEEPPRA